MIVLAIDSALSGCSVSVYNRDRGCLAERSLAMSRGQAEHLMPMIYDVLKAAEVAYKDLGLIAVTHGPGAFTGLRIGIAAAKSLALALDIPVVGVDTMRAVFETYLLDDNLAMHPYSCVLLETKRQDYYAQMFDTKTKNAVSDVLCIPVHEVISLMGGRDCVIIGDANDRFRSEIKDSYPSNFFYEVLLPSSSVIASCAEMMYRNDNKIKGCFPVYARPPDVSLPKQPLRHLV